MSSEDVDDCSSLSERLDIDFSRVLLSVDFSTFLSVCRLMPRVVCNFCIGSCFGVVFGPPNGFIFIVRLCSMPFSRRIAYSYASCALRVCASNSFAIF